MSIYALVCDVRSILPSTVKTRIDSTSENEKETHYKEKILSRLFRINEFHDELSRSKNQHLFKTQF